MSNSSLGLSIDADRFDLYTAKSFLSNRDMTIYSDNKIKRFTEDLDGDNVFNETDDDYIGPALATSDNADLVTATPEAGE